MAAPLLPFPFSRMWLKSLLALLPKLDRIVAVLGHCGVRVPDCSQSLHSFEVNESRSRFDRASNGIRNSLLPVRNRRAYIKLQTPLSCQLMVHVADLGIRNLHAHRAVPKRFAGAEAVTCEIFVLT